MTAPYIDTDLRVRFTCGPVGYLHVRRNGRGRRVFTIGGRGHLWAQHSWWGAR